MPERVVSPARTEEDAAELSLRPKRLNEFIGQERLKENLRIAIEAARKRGEPLDHILFYGPPGLGKTTLSLVCANEMEAPIRITSGPAMERAGDLAAVLTNLDAGSVLFIDEIHRLNPVVAEILYPAMEDFTLDLVIGKGPSARTMRLPLPRFTVIGATTRPGLLTAPLRDRFGMHHTFHLYELDDLRTIILRSAEILNVGVTQEGAVELAKRSRGTPRIANRLLRRCRDYALVRRNGVVDAQVVLEAMHLLGIDDLGLDEFDHRYLGLLLEKYGGGPAGIETLAASLGEETDTIVDVYEPYLLQLGFLDRTPRGRKATRAAAQHLGLPFPQTQPPQQGSLL
ncbi:MAG: Holliday junction branch migration DNA helicase RuvB [Chthonomonadales bacterium]